jgi:phage-related protein (TIGR01555 family)
MAKKKLTPEPELDALANDGWVNVLTGLGQLNKDKRESALPTIDLMSYEALATLYRASDLAARICDLPAEDMMREGFDVRIPDNEEGAEEIGAYLDGLGAEAALEQALKYRRVYGGAAILIGANDGVSDLSLPLNEAGIRSIDYLNVFDPFEARITEYQENPAKKDFGRPTMYQLNPHVMGAGLVPLQKIHASRILQFQGPLANRRQLRSAPNGINQGWGDSVLVRVAKEIRDYDQAWGGVSHLMTDLAQAVYMIAGLANALLADKDKTIKKRMQIINMSRSMLGAVLLDKDGESFERKGTPMSGVAEVLREKMNRLAAAAGIPTVVLFGISPGGMNATGESDMQVWYDKVRAAQRRHLKPQTEDLIRLVMLAKDGPTSGVEPDNYSIQFRPLWQMSDTEKAEVRNKNAQTDQLYLNMGVASTSDIAESRFGGDEYGMDLLVDMTELEAREAQSEELNTAQHEATVSNLEEHGSPLPPAKPPEPGKAPPSKG